MQNNGKIFIVIGGTGGHVYPGLAFYESLAKRYPESKIEFIIGKKELSLKEMKKKTYVYHRISSAPFPRTFNLINIIKFTYRMAIGLTEACFLVLRNKPAIVVAFGSYFSVPISLIAAIKNIPLILHEQNLYPGLANRFLSVIARKIAVSFEDSIKYFPEEKCVLTGNPVRKEILPVKREDALGYFALEGNRFNILVFGGSLGSKSINSTVIGILPYLEGLNEKIQFIHLCGKSDIQPIIDQYAKYNFDSRVYNYLEDMRFAYGIADAVISRAGAGAVTEIISAGIPAILIPFPEAASQHQYYNAKFLSDKGAAVLFDEITLGSEALALKLLPLINDEKIRKDITTEQRNLAPLHMSAADNIAGIVLEELSVPHV